MAVDVKCDVNDAAIAVDDDVNPPPRSGKKPRNQSDSDDFSAGHSGGAAEIAIRDALDRLVREDRANDHLIVITPDGRAGHQPDDYRRMLGTYRKPAGEEVLQLQLDERLRSSLLREVDENAKPYVIVCARGVKNIGPEHLEKPLQAAAEAQAPIRLLTF